MKGFHLEQAAGVTECYAVIYAPGRNRKRFSENVVHVKDSEQAARDAADAAKNFIPRAGDRAFAFLRRLPFILFTRLARLVSGLLVQRPIA